MKQGIATQNEYSFNEVLNGYRARRSRLLIMFVDHGQMSPLKSRNT